MWRFLLYALVAVAAFLIGDRLGAARHQRVVAVGAAVPATEAVVAYSVDAQSTASAVRQAQAVPLVYAGWTARFYVDGAVPQHVLADLRRYNAQVVAVADPMARSAPPGLWKYLAAADPAVHRALFRDAGAPVSTRELMAVHDWIDSGLPFHVMHDQSVPRRAPPPRPRAMH